MEMNEIQHCDCFTGLGKLPNESVDCIVTSRGHSRFNPENNRLRLTSENMMTEEEMGAALVAYAKAREVAAKSEDQK